jgi:hypothetical protein
MGYSVGDIVAAGALLLTLLLLNALGFESRHWL